MCAKYASGFCEWNGPPWTPPPEGPRITSGTPHPGAVAVLAAKLMIMSKAQEMKSMNCISATGRMPIMAAPTAAPTMADSAIGVSMTRSAPNSSSRPSVTLNAPP